LGFQITESKDFFCVLLAIGEMYRTVNKHRLVFIADEAARLDEIDNDDATLAHWIAVNRDIFDDKNNTFGFIYTLQGREDRLPRAIWDPQIQNRLGKSAVLLKNLAKPDVEQFLTKLIDELIDKAKVAALVGSGEIEAAKYDGPSYPFTNVARAEFVDFFKRTTKDAKPRDICDRLNMTGFIAIKSKSRLIDEECLKKANI
jgi:hypothetical protein